LVFFRHHAWFGIVKDLVFTLDYYKNMVTDDDNKNNNNGGFHVTHSLRRALYGSRG